MQPCICAGQPCVAWSCAALCDVVLCSTVWRGLVQNCVAWSCAALFVWCLLVLCVGCSCCVVVHVLCSGARAVLTAACSACALPAESECLLCCQGGAEGVCKVYLFNSTGYPLDEGTLCSKGYCSKVSGSGSNQVGVALPVHPQQSTAQGKCIQATTDLGTRLFGLLTNLTANELCECPHSLTSLSLSHPCHSLTSLSLPHIPVTPSHPCHSLLNCVTPPLTLPHTLPLPRTLLPPF